MARKKTIEIDIDAVFTRTPAAFYVRAEGKQFWLPMSQLEELNVAALEEAWESRTKLSCLQIPKWLADRHGLEGV